ncbi:MAG: hypothetical protein U9R27_10490 [Campylobacterota bacterium]|nr:hypothetical protein [Campylobacterota bacterium]
MFTLENLPIIIIIGIILLNIRTIIGTISMLQYEFKIPVFETIELSDIEPEVESIIKPLWGFF